MLKKKNRITPPTVFKEVFTQGERKDDKYFRLIFRENNLEYPRYGIVVSTQISKSAVERNILKRRIRSILRDFIPSFSKGLDIVIITKRDCFKMDFLQLKECLNKLLVKLFQS